MSDPALYDRVAARVGDWVENALNPQALAEALTVLLAEHEPAHKHAGAVARLGLEPGKCSMCAREGEPLHVFQGDLNNEGVVEMHCHGYYDWCDTCPSESDGFDDPVYPCPPVRAVADALGVI